MDDGTMWERMFWMFEGRKVRDIAEQDQMLAARRDFEPTIPIPDLRVAKCSHYTPVEDDSDWAYLHRTWGCPDEGAEWPEEVMYELARSNPGLHRVIRKQAILTPFLRDESLAREANEFGY